LPIRRGSHRCRESTLAPKSGSYKAASPAVIFPNAAIKNAVACSGYECKQMVMKNRKVL
jgi:hypothetical protein